MQPLLAREDSHEERLSSTSPPVTNMESIVVDHDAPTEEQDLGGAADWTQENEDGERTPTKSKKWKGKGKAKAVDSDTDEEEQEEREQDAYAEGSNEATYPPVKTEDNEEKRIQENLRKWDEAERQKRRLNRDASISLSTSQQTSVVGEVGRRASYLWSRNVRTRPSGMGSGSGHQVLGGEDLDDGEPDPSIPLSHVDRSPLPSPPIRLTNRQGEPITKAEEDGYIDSPIQNPFEDPGVVLARSPSQSSKESDATLPENGSAVMRSQPNTPAVGVKVKKNTTKADASSRPVLQATTSFGKMSFPAPPPAPLILIPPPKTPPPQTFSRQPSESPPPLPAKPKKPGQAVDNDASQPKEVRWWTDWICGCSEGPDRGGEDQAGRTNPFE